MANKLPHPKIKGSKLASTKDDPKPTDKIRRLGEKKVFVETDDGGGFEFATQTEKQARDMMQLKRKTKDVFHGIGPGNMNGREKLVFKV